MINNVLLDMFNTFKNDINKISGIPIKLKNKKGGADMIQTRTKKAQPSQLQKYAPSIKKVKENLMLPESLQPNQQKLSFPGIEISNTNTNTTPSINTNTNKTLFEPTIEPSIKEVVIPKKGTAHKIFTYGLKIFFALFTLTFFYVMLRAYTAYNSTMSNAAEIRTNWPDYRCQPAVIPFAGIITGGKVNTLINGLECATTIFKNSFLRFMSPFITFFEKIVDVLYDLVKSVQNIRKMLDYLRDSIETFLYDIAKMLYGYGIKFSELIERFLALFKIVEQVFEDNLTGLRYIMSVGHDIFNPLSLILSPIEGIIKFFCLHSDTLITMKDDSKKQIKNIKVGEKVKRGGRVLAVHVFSGKNVQMYLYKNKIIAASSHLIKEKNKWIRMKDSVYSKKLNKEEEIIYCLTTKKGKMMVEGNLFADYMEVKKGEHMTHILNIIMEHLTKKPSNLTGKTEKVWGFHKDTLILSNSKKRKIKDIQIGDKIGNNNIVVGITTIDGKNVNLYDYNGIICSGNIIVKDNDNWVLVKSVGKLLPNTSILYNLFTSNGNIFINDFEFKDYCQTYSNDVNNEIDTFLENILH